MGTRCRARGRGARTTGRGQGVAWSRRTRGHRLGGVLDDDLEQAVVEGLSRRFGHADNALALALSGHLEGTVVAVGVVAGLSERDEARPRAAAHALFGVVAGGAVTPEVARRAIARVAERLGALPDVLERRVADVATGPRGGGEGRASLDGAVGLDAERRSPRAARSAVTAEVVPAQDRLVRAEVSDVVARPETHT